MSIDCTCTVGWASDPAFAEEIGATGILTTEEFGEPPTDPWCPIHIEPPS